MSVVRFRLAEARKYRQLLDTVDVPMDVSHLRPHSAPPTASACTPNPATERSDRASQKDATYVPVLTTYAQSIPARDDLPAMTTLEGARLELQILELSDEVRRLRESREVRLETRAQQQRELARRTAVDQDWADFAAAADSRVRHEIDAVALKLTNERLLRDKCDRERREREARTVKFKHPSSWSEETRRLDERPVTASRAPTGSLWEWPDGRERPLLRPLRVTPAHQAELARMRVKALQRCEADEQSERDDVERAWSSGMSWMTNSAELLEREARERRRLDAVERYERRIISDAACASSIAMVERRAAADVEKEYVAYRRSLPSLRAAEAERKKQGREQLKEATEAYRQRAETKLKDQWKQDMDARVSLIGIQRKLDDLRAQRAVLQAQFDAALHEDEAQSRLRAETIALEQKIEYRDAELSQLERSRSSLEALLRGKPNGMSAPLD